MGGLTPVPDDQLATVVTTLEMRERPRLRPTLDSDLRLLEWVRPDAAKYRALFTRIGAPWLWYSRIGLDEARLLEVIRDPDVSIFAAVDRGGIEVGMLELDFREPNLCIIAYFGLVPELTGAGHGRWLMAEALRRAWLGDIRCVRLNTCTLDHPSALSFYRAQGFAAVRRTVETFPDPRAIGLLPADAAPQIPYLAASRR